MTANTAVQPRAIEDRRERLSIVQRSAREFLAGEWSMKQFRALIDSGEGFSPALWKKACELGWPGTLLAEADGGSDGDFTELAAILEECGAALAPTPLAAHAAASQIVMRSKADALKRALLALAADGSAPLTLALREAALTSDRGNVTLAARRAGDGWVLEGMKLFVPAAREAGMIVVAARLDDGALGLFAVPGRTQGLETERLKPLDWSALDTLRLAQVACPADRLIARGDEAERLLGEALVQGDVLACAEIAGIADSALELAVAYAKDRVAFGKPIGQFQGVKHRLVNLRADIEIARALTRVATQDIANQDPKRRVSAAQAAFWCVDALKKVPEGCLQVFGGIGFTWEHDIHLYLRRAATLASLLGERAEYRETVARNLDDGSL
jgi:alkylation response protein AidB-like acyl-CoA dehydrogenase